MSRSIIHTELAPAAIGPYSQAVRIGDTVYLSGQIPLLPSTGVLLEGNVDAQARQVFENMQAVCAAVGGSLADIARLGIFLTDLGDFAAVNAVMAEYFSAPYPARSTVQVSALPRGALVEVDAILVLS
jgi:reactive intermediate/imine deaminase